MGKTMKAIDKVDQKYAWIVIVIVALWLMAKNYFAFTVFLFAIFLLVIIFLFNKGRKNVVNLKSDITPLALLIVLAFIIMIFLPASPYTIILIMTLVLFAALLYVDWKD